MKRFAAVLLICLCVLLSACGGETTPPLIERADSGYITDQAGILSQPAKEAVNDICRRLHTACGAELCVVTVDFTKDRSAADFAAALLRQWELPANSTLLLMAPGQDEASLAVGAEMEKVLTETERGAILEEHYLPYEQKQAYDAAAENTVQALYERYGRVYDLNAAPEQSGFHIPTGVLIGIAVAAVYLIIKARYKH